MRSVPTGAACSLLNSITALNTLSKFRPVISWRKVRSQLPGSFGRNEPWKAARKVWFETFRCLCAPRRFSTCKVHNEGGCTLGRCFGGYGIGGDQWDNYGLANASRTGLLESPALPLAGLQLLTAAAVHRGQAAKSISQRRAVLHAACQRNPGRFVRRPNQTLLKLSRALV